MTTKTKVALGAVALLATFAAGRYSVQEPDVKHVEQTDESKDVDIDRDKTTVETIVKDPSGKETRTIVTEDKSKVKKRIDTTTKVDESITQPKRGTLHVSALLGVDIHNQTKPIYGLHITKQVLGPMSYGLWGLSNGTVGASVGLEF